MKKKLIVAAVILSSLVGFSSCYVYSDGYGYGNGYHRHHRNMPPPPPPRGYYNY